ncbi:MAG: 5'-methylthioadenosine/adenosylhomocysteine nucleosidase [Oscillospiraceae bacterium]|nr:5'-methylthioadenosine/adenosylhomocysteine nucleosidase [Oscillospiraceae bacterium]
MIGIIGAMELEVVELIGAMENPITYNHAGMKFISGKLEGTDAVVVRSGVGKVNAAVCTQILIDRYQPKAVINTGIAGSVGLDVNIGDIVLSTSAQQHDMNAVPFGYEVGIIPQQDCSDFPADPQLLELAQSCCAEYLPEIKVHTGRVVTGDLFVARKEQKTRLRERFDALCTEMEGAAIAHAAWLNQTPYLVVRAISDNANAEAVEDYPTFEKHAAACSAKLVRSMLRRLA